ncbi:HNH endonuclease [Roseovarius sp. MMSF_3281]|uniref:HNH endonuclease n=1 Tax=Roseovarius sp. MMSF_3281 TaxID=3046694 RepID=UPI00353210D7
MGPGDPRRSKGPSLMKKCRNCPTRIPAAGPTRCQECARRNAALTRLARDADPNHKAKKRAYDIANRERARELKRKRYRPRSNSKTCVDCDAQIPARGPARCIEHHEAYWTAYYSEKNKRWPRENVEKNRARRRRRRLRVMEAEGAYTAEQWAALQHVTGNRCLCCGIDADLEPDHVIPLAKGGTNWIDNIQPLCRSCNARKRLKSTDYRSKETRTMLKQWSGAPESNRQAKLDV